MIIELNDTTVVTVAEQLSSDQRSVVPVSDGTRLVFQILPDEFAYIRDDEDWIGKVAVCERDRSRPDGFDGAARKVGSHHGDIYWWQPPSDVLGNDASVELLRRELIDILNYGYSLISVELQEQCSHGDWHEVAGTSIGGLGPNTDWNLMVSEVIAWLHDSREMVA